MLYTAGRRRVVRKRLESGLALMSDTLTLASLADGTILSPFSRLRQLLGGIPPGERPIDLTLGEPRETMPAFVAAKITEAEALFAKYPPIRGSDELRGA
ncbi:MAG: hypothetical protein J0H65_07510, partial [Rhizobiales bacterium]|nr:hypothetical protein [Hyphomicrobiales bacterium]